MDFKNYRVLNMGKPYHLFKYNPVENLKVTHGNDFTVIAHRGASAYYPENTLSAFEGAIAMGADMVELDVQLTADKEVIIFHDEKISRCTNGRGKIADYTLAELKKLDAGSWFDREFAGARLPTLSEVLDLCKNRIAVNIEIKTEAVTGSLAGGIEEKCLKIVDQAAMRGHVVFSSFDPRAVIHLKEIDKTIAAAVLFEKGLYGAHPPSEIVGLLGADAFNCSKKELSKAWLADLEAHDIPINIYTINDERNMRRLMSLGVNGIFTNHPDLLKWIAAEVRQKQTILST